MTQSKPWTKVGVSEMVTPCSTFKLKDQADSSFAVSNLPRFTFQMGYDNELKVYTFHAIINSRDHG